MNRIILLALVAFIFACSENEHDKSETSRNIWAEIEANDYKAIDFSKIASPAWSKVCFFGPYNNNSEIALGFPWHLSEHTDVLKSDGHNVIVFATESKVIEFVVHSRAYGDFWTLSGQCLKRENSQLIKDAESGSWRNYVRPKA